MRTTIDKAGRIVVPKAIRERLGLVDGGEVEIIEHDGNIEISPIYIRVELVEGPHGPVLHPVDPIPPLTSEVVRATLESIRK